MGVARVLRQDGVNLGPWRKCYPKVEESMTGKQQLELLLRKLPDNCSLEDIQYHLYVLDKVQRGLEEARNSGTLSQEEAEKRLSKWVTE
jgi:hypothetical protein